MKPCNENFFGSFMGSSFACLLLFCLALLPPSPSLHSASRVLLRPAIRRGIERNLSKDSFSYLPRWRSYTQGAGKRTFLSGLSRSTSLNSKPLLDLVSRAGRAKTKLGDFRQALKEIQKQVGQRWREDVSRTLRTGQKASEGILTLGRELRRKTRQMTTFFRELKGEITNKMKEQLIAKADAFLGFYAETEKVFLDYRKIFLAILKELQVFKYMKLSKYCKEVDFGTYLKLFRELHFESPRKLAEKLKDLFTKNKNVKKEDILDILNDLKRNANATPKSVIQELESSYNNLLSIFLKQAERANIHFRRKRDEVLKSHFKKDEKEPPSPPVQLFGLHPSVFSLLSTPSLGSLEEELELEISDGSEGGEGEAEWKGNFELSQEKSLDFEDIFSVKYSELSFKTFEFKVGDFSSKYEELYEALVKIEEEGEVEEGEKDALSEEIEEVSLAGTALLKEVSAFKQGLEEEKRVEETEGREEVEEKKRKVTKVMALLGTFLDAMPNVDRSLEEPSFSRRVFFPSSLGKNFRELIVNVHELQAQVSESHLASLERAVGRQKMQILLSMQQPSHLVEEEEGSNAAIANELGESGKDTSGTKGSNDCTRLVMERMQLLEERGREFEEILGKAEKVVEELSMKTEKSLENMRGFAKSANPDVHDSEGILSYIRLIEEERAKLSSSLSQLLPNSSAPSSSEDAQLSQLESTLSSLLRQEETNVGDKTGPSASSFFRPLPPHSGETSSLSVEKFLENLIEKAKREMEQSSTYVEFFESEFEQYASWFLCLQVLELLEIRKRYLEMQQEELSQIDELLPL